MCRLTCLMFSCCLDLQNIVLFFLLAWLWRDASYLSACNQPTLSLHQSVDFRSRWLITNKYIHHIYKYIRHCIDSWLATMSANTGVGSLPQAWARLVVNEAFPYHWWMWHILYMVYLETQRLHFGVLQVQWLVYAWDDPRYAAGRPWRSLHLSPHVYI